MLPQMIMVAMDAFHVVLHEVINVGVLLFQDFQGGRKSEDFQENLQVKCFINHLVILIIVSSILRGFVRCFSLPTLNFVEFHINSSMILASNKTTSGISHYQN